MKKFAFLLVAIAAFACTKPVVPETPDTPEPPTPPEPVIEDTHEAVDLGLSVKWATCNLGAENPEDFGGYYSWAGLQDVTSKEIWLDWSSCPDHEGDSYSSGWIKYTADGLTSLELTDDAANVEWKCGWRIPTTSEWTELIENCTWRWETVNSVKGYRVTSNKEGFMDKSIFLPACGYRDFDFTSGVGTYGCYWTSDLCVTYPFYAYRLYFKSTSYKTEYRDRSYGQSLRPVR